MEFDTASNGDDWLKLAGLGKKSQVLERLDIRLRPGSGEQLYAGSRSHEGPDIGFTRGEVHQKIVVNRVGVAGERGRTTSGREFESGVLEVISKFTTQHAAGSVTQPGAESEGIGETGTAIDAGVLYRLRVEETAASARADFPALCLEDGCHGGDHKKRKGEEMFHGCYHSTVRLGWEC